MAEQGNILSFDDVRRSSVKPRPSLGARKADTGRAKKRGAVKTVSESRRRPSAQAKKATASTPPRQGPARGSTTVVRAKGQSRAAISQRTEPAAKPSRWETMKRGRSKNKAGKAFSKQFGDTPSSASTSGPRAALYKGEMGRQHKRMTNMQSTGSQKKVTPGAGLAAPRFDWRSSPKRTAGIVVTLGLVLACMFLYPAAQQYYTTLRQNEALQAEYTALQERNESIQSQVNQLTSAEGIEDRVRKEYGWVKEGENAVTVYGLDSNNETPSYVKNVPAGSVHAPDTWYSPILDLVFGVS